MNAILHRLRYREKQTEGELRLYDGGRPVMSCVTLELPWLDNQEGVSCIPKGSYQTTPRVSDHLGRHYRVLQPDGSEVAGRSMILVHVGNFNRNIKGCILPGRTFVDLDGDGWPDVTNSRETLDLLLDAAPDGFAFEIAGEH